MATDRLAGKLAVILHADVIGSTTLVQQDEQKAHHRNHWPGDRCKEQL